MKKSVYLFVFLFALVFMTGFISAVTSCAIVSDGCSASQGTVMKLSAYTNAHGSLASASNNYAYALCCDGLTSTGTTCTGTNNLLGLSSSTNAHAQVPSYTSYDYDVCYEDLSCTYVTSSSCPSTYPIETVSLSAISNAHLASFSTYPYKICCSSGAGAGATCGNSLIETGEDCDDGNTNSYDGCSYSACTVESGYTCYQPIANGPSCCYSQNPYTFFLKNDASFSGGSLLENDLVKMYVWDDFCLATGTERTISVYKDRTILSDVLITTITASATNAVFSGSWLVSAEDRNKIGTGTSSIYFVMDEPSTGSTIKSSNINVIISFDCGNGVVEGTEECDDNNTADGDGCSATCTIEPGYTCTTGNPSVCSIPDLCSGVTCPSGEICDSNSGNCIAVADTCASLGYECGVVNGESCGTCASGEDCVSGQCSVVQCSINSVAWSTNTPSPVSEGDSVFLDVVVSSGCSGSMTFEVKEDDGALNSDDPVSTNPSPVAVSSGSSLISASWTAEYQADIDGLQTDPPEYYFTASISGVSLKSASDLQVLEQDVAQCLGIASCADYTESQCGVLSCSSTHYSDISYYENSEGDRCSDVSNWGCVWDSTNKLCNANQEITTQCGVCGNYLVDYGEQCDDGNTVSGDGCSSTCQFEGLNSPCPQGTTLCSDGTCSIECRYTDTDPSSCDYDSVCDSNEGCTCSDCNDEQDSCISGTICNLESSFCCDPQSDGACNPYCSFSDPDCGTSVCGNGFMESGEQCDDGNTVSGDGCSNVCGYEVVSGPPCPEGTALCNDNTCSLNCFYTDAGYNYTYITDNCDTGLTYSLTDNACCDTSSDTICNPYCSFSDPDCDIVDAFTSVGNCGYVDNSNDDCEDGILERNLTAVWIGQSERPASCRDIVDRLVCPAQIEVPFFSVFQFVLAVVLIVLIYFLIKSRIEEKHQRRARKSLSKKKRSTGKKK